MAALFEELQECSTDLIAIHGGRRLALDPLQSPAIYRRGYVGPLDVAPSSIGSAETPVPISQTVGDFCLRPLGTRLEEHRFLQWIR